MTERQILFSGPMVRAILEGKKTQTRRVIKPQPHSSVDDIGYYWRSDRPVEKAWLWLTGGADYVAAPPDDEFFACPYGQPGDRLWVRETWCQFPESAPDGMGECVYYRADQRDDDRLADDIMKRNSVKWKPSIHMPRKYCRLVLEVKAVRVEQLNKMCGHDLRAEGFGWNDASDDHVLGEFKNLWNSLNIKREIGRAHV